VNIYHNFLHQFTNVEEIQKALLTCNQSRFEFLYDEYANLLHRIANFSMEELDLIKTAYSQYETQIAPGGRTEESTHQFMNRLGRKGRKLFKESTESVYNFQNPENKSALVVLESKIREGYNLFNSGSKFKDGDPISDSVIWTPTNFSDPILITHIVLAHFMERYTYSYLLHHGFAVIFPKDYLLNIMDDAIIISGVCTSNNSEIFSVWTREKEDGGLAYINPAKIHALKEVFDSK
jgi:hypothetical protein